MPDTLTGLGDPQASFCVCAPNRPPYEPLLSAEGVVSLQPGDIAAVAAATGNHWRKIFNVFAKLMAEPGMPGNRLNADWSWQTLRDQWLLQAGSGTALLFTAPVACGYEQVRLYMGRQYAREQGFFESAGARWLNNDFAINDQGWIVCPYFDYRQLSDARIRALAELIRTTHLDVI